MVCGCCAWFGIDNAHAACDANSNPVSDCFDNVKGAAQDVFKTNDGAQKSKTVGEAVGDCFKCASEATADMLRKFQSGDSSN